MREHGFLKAALIMWLACWFIVGVAVAVKAQPDSEPVGRDSRDSGPHEQYHDFYKKWMQPGGFVSCCNANEYLDGDAKMQHITGDCEPTDAELRRGPDGKPEWWARLPKYLGGEFIPIPDDKVIREINPEPSRAHLCYNYGKVLCFVPPFGGF